MTQELAKRTSDPLASLVAMIDRPELKKQIARALPKQLTLDRFIRICLTTLRQRPDLAKCEPLSIVGSIVEASQLGLELDPVLGHGYLVPFWNREQNMKRCIFMPGYRGFIHLMRNSGLIHGVNAEIVRTFDSFHVRLGIPRVVDHEPDWDNKERDNQEFWRGAYATVTFSSGYADFEYLPKSDILKAMERSPSKDKDGKIKGPWITDTAEMWKKTPIRRIAKRMPLSPQSRELVRAATLDEYRENEEYISKESPAPALIGAEPGQDTIELTAATVEAEAQPEPPANGGTPKEKKSRVKSKSEKKSAAAIKREMAKPEKGAAQPPKAQINEKPASDAPERIGAGQAIALQKFTDERGLSKELFIEILGAFGFEKPEQVTKKSFPTIWAEIGNRRVK